jgi:hypothetical protein
LIDDYIKLLTYLIEIENEVTPKSINEPYQIVAKVEKCLREIIMFDVAQKIRCSKIIEKCEEDGAIKRTFDEKNAGLTRSVGLIEFKKRIGNYKIGIQIQGIQYRRFVEKINGEKVEQFYERLKDAGIWFIDTFGANQFNKFGVGFRYTYEKIEGFTISDLIRKISSDADYLESVVDQVEEIASKAK